MSSLFQRHKPANGQSAQPQPEFEMKNSSSNTPSAPAEAHTTGEKHHILPVHRVNHNGHKITKHIAPDGESGRKGIHPLHFFRIVWRSSSDASRLVNILWPVVPAAISLRYARKDLPLAIFILSYIAMVPCANLIGFSGQELARKLPKVFGVLLETTLGSVVEIILFMVLLTHDDFEVIRAAIMGSILATQLLCLGLCFFAGGMRRDEQTFDEVVSEVGSGLLLTAGLGLLVPTAFYYANLNALYTPDNSTDPALTGAPPFGNEDQLDRATIQVSRITSIFLIIAYAFYVWFQMRTHHGLYDAVLEADEEKDADRHKDLKKDKLTFTECIIALAVSIALVTIIAIALVQEIPYIVEHHNVSEMFMGLILVPLVEKAAEHMTAVDEAWDNQMNFALAHVLGATLQTALFNAPLTVIVAWGLGKNMSLNFDIFNISIFILSILVVGNFLRDQKSNYLEGALCVLMYGIIATGAFYFPHPHGGGEAEGTAAIE